MKKELISIIVPIYNGEKYLKKCIASLQKQTYKNIEIILVDDGSTDSSLKLCKEYAKKDNRIKVLSSKNYGVSHARNYGIKNATSNYITFVDVDDFISKYYCEILWNGIKDNDLSVGGAEIIYDFNQNINEELNFDCKYFDKDAAYYNLIRNSSFQGYVWNKLYKKEIIEKLGSKPFNESIFYCEDTLFNANYLKFCQKISFNPTIIYYYYQNPNSVTHLMKFTEKHYSNLDSMKNLVKIYNDNSKINLSYIYDFYLYIIAYLEYCIYKSKLKIKLKNSETYNMFKYVLKDNKVGISRKLKMILRYYFPIIIFKIKNLKIKRVGEYEKD